MYRPYARPGKENNPPENVSIAAKGMNHTRTPLLDLSRPFKIPMKQTRHSLRRRTSKRTDYTSMFAEEDLKPKLKIDNIEHDLFRPFVLPSKNLTPSKRTDVSLGMLRTPEWKPKPLHDPHSEFAIVLFDPTIDELPDNKPKTDEEVALNTGENQTSMQNENSRLDLLPSSLGQFINQGPELAKPKKLIGANLDDIFGFNKPISNEPKLVPVVIDPKLAQILRPHQVEGVKFLYRCTMGLVDPRAHGCIMADGMGLGKTLQCISLLWSLLRQSPKPSATRRGTIEKALVICPSSLVNNWANEFDKWLGKGAVNTLAIDGKSVKSSELSAKLKEWGRAEGRRVTHPVLVISYETLRRNSADLGSTEIGLLLADEGHRLKNGDSLTFNALNALNVKRRVILSGTPIQNDLSEYFSLLNFANPGLLGTRAEFRKNYEIKILKARDSEATDKELEEGDLKLKELLQIVHRFIIRRSNDILAKYLPVKYEHVVFVGLTEFQENVYQHYLQSKEVNKILRVQEGSAGGTQSLQGINILKEICTHPDLVDLDEDIPGVDKFLPSDYEPPSRRMQGRNRQGAVRPWYSGKFMVLCRMLARIRADTNDKIVLISNYTQTLDMIEQLCREHRYGTVRLDGSMAINKRQKLVDRFNDPTQPEFVFLLSSKAGGCGINLIGANRLVLLDPDWNPAADQQALARVWRDGQKKDCFVYRFIATGSIEEKILQRQSMKQSLSSCVVDEKENVERIFSTEMLKALFKFNSDTKCDTHDTFKCRRCVHGKQFVKAPAMLYGDATTWNHYSTQQLGACHDKLLQQELEQTDENKIVDYVFEYISHV